jgi:hypothetical protein
MVKGINFELVYLGMLTREGMKPLSRWEGRFGRREVKTLKRIGLETEIVKRRLATQKRVDELIFSRDKGYLHIYAQNFKDKPLKKTPETMRLEGKLFGYPECCVEQFISEGYRPNGLDPEDQQLLFHWACRDCKLTPLLLPHYQRVHQEAIRYYSQMEDAQLLFSKRFFKTSAAAACLALLPIGCWGRTPPIERDVHWLSIDGDRDEDLLLDEIELYFEIDPTKADTDQDGVLDGVQLAKAFWAEIEKLPREPTPDGPYLIENHAYGLETCERCGATINMGYVEIINPMKELSIEISYIGLHYLEHGSFSYDGTLHDGAIDPKLLSEILDYKVE